MRHKGDNKIRRSIIACQATIKAKLADGYDKRTIYDELTAATKIACAYTTFSQYVRALGYVPISLPKRKNQTKPRQQSLLPIPSKELDNQSIHSPNPDEKDIY